MHWAVIVYYEDITGIYQLDGEVKQRYVISLEHSFGFKNSI